MTLVYMYSIAVQVRYVRVQGQCWPQLRRVTLHCTSAPLQTALKHTHTHTHTHTQMKLRVQKKSGHNILFCIGVVEIRKRDLFLSQRKPVPNTKYSTALD